MKTVQGNLLDMFDSGEFDIIMHGCNCFCNMGGGIAAQIAARYPEAQKRDNNTEPGDTSKLGTVDYVWMSKWWVRLFPWLTKRKFIINAYTQYNPGADGNLDAVQQAFKSLAEGEDAMFLRGAKIGIPAIGCGIAGLDWANVETVMLAECSHLDITLVEFVPN